MSMGGSQEIRLGQEFFEPIFFDFADRAYFGWVLPGAEIPAHFAAPDRQRQGFYPDGRGLGHGGFSLFEGGPSLGNRGEGFLSIEDLFRDV